MDNNSPLRKKTSNNRSRSRSRSKEHHHKKSESKVLTGAKAKYDDEENKRGSSPEDNELERKFKDFEAEIHAIDPSNKSEKNETKQKKTFETTENLILLYNKRIFVEGFPLEELEDKDHNPKLKEEYKDFFKDSNKVAILTPKTEGKPLLLIEFESRESMDSAFKPLENYEDQGGLKFKLYENINSEENYIKKVINFTEIFKKNPQQENKEALNKTHEEKPSPEPKDSSPLGPNDNIVANNISLPSLYPQQNDSENDNVMNLQNGYPYLNYDQSQNQYLYSLKQPNYGQQTYPQYQYTAGYYSQPPMTDVNPVNNYATTAQNNAYANPTSNSYANSPLPYKNDEFNNTNADYGFNLNSLNLQMTENPNAFSMMPKILPEANVFIKNLNPITTTKDLENAFRVYGNILSCKIATDYYGQSLSYGYIQFELKESADTCIQQANNAVFQDMIISAQPFNSKLNKIDGRNNLYIKNLPTYLNDDQLNQKIMEIFSKFGPITSSVVKLDRSLNRPFAFVCFENHIYADMAFKALHDTDPFRSGNRLYISWAEKKIDRVKRLTELHASQQNLQQNNYGVMGMGVGGYYQNTSATHNYKNFQGRGNN